MADDYTFKAALLFHMERGGTKIADLASGSGVSESAIKKLRTRNDTTSAENALAIAKFYGLSLEEFMMCGEGRPKVRFSFETNHPDLAAHIAAAIQSFERDDK